MRSFLTVILVLTLIPILAACSKTGPPVDTINLVMVGDIMLSRNVADYVAKHAANDFAFPFRNVAVFLKAADIATGNLETPVSGRGKKLDKTYVFNAPPEAMAGIKGSGLRTLCLANNHILDYGEEALNDTVAGLDKSEISHYGLSDDGGPGQRPVIIACKGLKFGFLAYADIANSYSYPGVYKGFKFRPAEARPEFIISDVEKLKPEVDVVVVALHWGIEYQDTPNEHQRTLARSLIDAGVKVVTGHHPHFLQSIERYKDGIIFYSLGNFVFDQRSRPRSRDSVMARVTFKGTRIDDVSYVPIHIDSTFSPAPIRNDYISIPAGAEFNDFVREQ